MRCWTPPESDEPATLYSEFGITVVYDPLQRTVAAELRPNDPCAFDRVGGRSDAKSDWRIRPWGP
jgi:hypothetical protein